MEEACLTPSPAEAAPSARPSELVWPAPYPAAPDGLLAAPTQAFHARLLQTAAGYLAGDDTALEGFVRREFPDLREARDRAAAALALHQAVHDWLPRTGPPQAEAKVRTAVRSAVARAAAVEQHWQRRLLAAYLPTDLGDAPLRCVEARLDVGRAVAAAALPPGERALVLALAESGAGWDAVRRRVSADLTASDEAFLRWQRAARQRWQRRLVGLRQD